MSCGDNAVCENSSCSCKSGYTGIPPLCINVSPITPNYTIAISGPSTINTCSSFALTALILGPLLSVQVTKQQWTLVDDGTSATTKLNALLKANPTSSSTLLVLPNLTSIVFSEDAAYTFVFTVEDSLNRTFSTLYSIHTFSVLFPFSLLFFFFFLLNIFVCLL